MTKGHCLSNFLIISFLFSAISISNGFAKAIYSRSAEFSPIQMSYSELMSLINKTQSIIKSANSAYKLTWESSKVTVEDGDSNKLSLDGEITEESFINAPKKGLVIKYSYQNSGGPISQFNINFSDYSRTIEVEGESQEQVDALFSLAVANINKLTIHFGGSKQRILIGAIISFVGWVLIIIILSNINRIYLFSKYLFYLFVLFGLFLIIFGFIFPWIGLLPGVAIYEGDASFMALYGGLLAISGIVITLLTCIITIIYSRYLAAETKAPPSEPPA